MTNVLHPGILIMKSDAIAVIQRPNVQGQGMLRDALSRSIPCTAMLEPTGAPHELTDGGRGLRGRHLKQEVRSRKLHYLGGGCKSDNRLRR